MMASQHSKFHEPTIVNRRARHDYFIEDTLECGIKLTGTEVKSIRRGSVNLAEGYVRAEENPDSLILHGAHVSEYPSAAAHHQHDPARAKVLLANKREIRKLAQQTRARGTTLIPLKMYFIRGRVKLLIGVARGKHKTDKRQAIAEREMKREIDRASSRRR